MKVSFIGAGGVGTTTAFAAGLSGKFDSIALVDILGDFARGKAMDLQQGLSLAGLDVEVDGGSDYALLKGSDAIVVTAGVANTDGTANREDLLASNRKIIADIARKVRKQFPKKGRQPFVVMVTNPLDAMLYTFIEAGDFDPKMTVGSGSLLDAERFRFYFAREFKMRESDVEPMAAGQHGREIVYLLSQTKAKGKPLAKMRGATKARLAKVCKRATMGAGEIIGLIEKGGTFYGPAMSVVKILMAYVGGKPGVLGVSSLLRGEYGISGVCLGAPAAISAKGVKEIKILPITDGEKKAMAKAAKFVRGLLKHD
jgi:malate dehydrogenase